MGPFFGIKDDVDISKFVGPIIDVEINERFVGEGGDIFDIIDFLGNCVCTGDVIGMCDVIGMLASIELSEIVSC